MKKWIGLIMAVVLVVAVLAGCSSADSGSSQQEEEPTVETDQIPEQEQADEPDTVASASPKESSDPAAVIHGLSADGFWLFALLDDVTLEEELVVDGVFYNRDDETDSVYRKLALYAQDDAYNVTAEYTLTLPGMTVNSPNFRVQNGTVKGDVTVSAEGFELSGATIDGNLVFETQELLDSASLDNGTVTGSISVAE